MKWFDGKFLKYIIFDYEKYLIKWLILSFRKEIFFKEYVFCLIEIMILYLCL